MTQTRTYYPAGGAMRIGSTLYYVLKDHLGSASVITDASGVTVSGGEQRYYPFGESRLTATMLTDKLFTGQREMAGLGIYHYGARFYSPKIGRFLSADTIVPSYANPQHLNRFAYVINNPLRYTDPTGHMDQDDNAGGGGSTCNIFISNCDTSGGSGGCNTLACSGNSGGSGNNGGSSASGNSGGCSTLACTTSNGGGGASDEEDPTADYLSLNVATGWPFAALGFDFQITVDDYFNWYLSPGVYIGTPGATFFDGWILQNEPTSEEDVEGFITSNSIFGGGGNILGGGATWGYPFDGELNWSDFAVEFGFTSPGGAVGWTYGFLIYNNGDATPWITWQDVLNQVSGAD